MPVSSILHPFLDIISSHSQAYSQCLENNEVRLLKMQLLKKVNGGNRHHTFGPCRHISFFKKHSEC